jgi:3-oxoacyl-[acyl-carrier-protein] synthase II
VSEGEGSPGERASTAPIAIVGLGAVASVGRTAAEIHEALCAGRSSLAPMAGFDHDWYTGTDLHEIDRGPAGEVPGRATGFLLDAVGQALADAGLGEDLDGIPVLVGTGLRELRSAELWWREGAPLRPGDLHFGTALAERFGATDTHTFSNACSASLYALALGTDLLAGGLAETVVVAGTDSITESMFGTADRLQSIPPDALRPFDLNRRGTVLGEGAAAIVLRREPRPQDTVHGWVRAAGINCDAYHPTAPDRDSIATLMRDVHRAAGLEPADLDLVMLHGTGTAANDLAEAQAVGEVFGVAAKVPVMTAIKSMTGHTSGASGLHSLITALLAMRSGRIPPTTTCEQVIEEAATFRIPRDGEARQTVRLAQVDAFGFGGINAVAIVGAAR